MPTLAKRHISQFVRRNCFRRLRFDVYSRRPEEEVRVEGGNLVPNPPPDRETVRQSLFLLQKAGKESEEGRYAELLDIFPTLTARPTPGINPARVRVGDNAPYFMLIDVWPSLTTPPAFLIESEYEVPDTFKEEMGLNAVLTEVMRNRPEMRGFSLGNARPDIIQALPPSAWGAENSPNQPVCQILSDGELRHVGAEDRRTGLRVIDCKLAAEASEAHFAEIAYYCVSLAAWLAAHSDGGGRPLSDTFFVRADAAVWPGQHGNSSVVKLRAERRERGEEVTEAEYLAAFAEDLDFLPADVFMARLKRFFQRDLAKALTPLTWQEVDFHVDNRCVGCEYLGHHWGRKHEDDPEPDAADANSAEERLRFCKPRAKRDDHISRLPGITDGARRMLTQHGVTSVEDLAALDPMDPVYSRHSALQAIRRVVPPRANILGRRTANLVAEAGTTAILPKHVDVKIHLLVEFDPASGITGLLAVQVDFQGSDTRQNRVFPVENRSLDLEWAALSLMLTHVQRCLLAADQRNWGTWDDGRPKRPTVQTYLWDRIAYEHLRRVIARHLHRLLDTAVYRNFAWLFPPEQVVADPNLLSLKSPVSIVSDAFRALMAVDSPHHYSLLDCARLYHEPWMLQDQFERLRQFEVNVMHADPLTDYVPIERIHEMWQDEREVAARNAARLARAGADVRRYREIPSPAEVARRLIRTMETKLWALRSVTGRLTAELRPRLEASAPSLTRLVNDRTAEPGISADGLVWREYHRLQASSQQFENDQLRAMNSEQREAKFASARVTCFLVDQDRVAAFNDMEIPDTSWHLWALRLADGSRDVRMKPGDSFSLLTEHIWPLQYLAINSLVDAHKAWSFMVPPAFRAAMARALPTLSDWDRRSSLLKASAATIVGIDRTDRRIIIDVSDGMNLNGSPFLFQAFDSGLMQLPLVAGEPTSDWGTLDPIVSDYAGSRITASLKGIGNPPLARQQSRIQQVLLPGVLGIRAGRGARQTAATPVDPFLWDASELSGQASPYDSRPGLANEATGIAELTPTQRRALENSISRRLSLIWGPPGTGKSLTCRALLAALAEWSVINQCGLRVLVTGSTWTAIDNVVDRMPEILVNMGSQAGAKFHRLKSAKSNSDVAPALRPFVTPTDRDNERFQELLAELDAPTGFVLVASSCQQVAALVKATGCDPERLRADLFDFVIIDEASQMDVAHTSMVFSGLAEGACVTVVGDDKQMPPIHPVPAPDGLEYVVGSIYDYYAHYQPDPIIPIMLDVNYRSNADILEFVQAAGYAEPITPFYPNQRLALIPRAPSFEEAPNWPVALTWTPEWDRLIDPDESLVAVIHENDMASQSNGDEAHAVACIVRSLWGRMTGLEGGRPSDRGDGEPMDLERFLTHGIGIVTPHRAQQATVIGLLERLLPRQPGIKNLYEAVDTVERFQGQERMVMIASLGLGDVDQIRGEENFLYSLNRFNVIASRAKAKFILLASRTLIDHIPSDPKVMRESKLIKHFAHSYLRSVREAELPLLGTVEIRTRPRRP